MFGGDLIPPKYVKRVKADPMTFDIQLSTIKPGIHGHFARQPNTDYHVKLLHYKQRLNAGDVALLAAESKRLTADAKTAKYDKHFEKKLFKRQIEERFRDKLAAYDSLIHERREKLRILLCQEEQAFYRETIEIAQKGAESRMDEMRKKAQLLKAQRENERLEIVNQKKMQQSIESCMELRPILMQKNLIESKNGQLQQIAEHENRKEAERELDKMWHALLLKEVAAKKEREEQDLLKKDRQKGLMLEVWEKQIRGKELLKEECDRVAAEDRLEMMKLQDQIRREEIEGLDSKRRKRDERAKELREQIEIEEKFLAQRKKEENALDNAFAQLAEDEIRREREKIQNTTSTAKKETAIYRRHLKQLEEERKKEDQELGKLLEEHRKAIEQKQDAAKCQLQRAREALHKSVVEGRAQQLEYKRKEAEQQLKLKEAENELLRMACETNERLQAEHDRLQAEAIRQYREDLKNQIEENNERRTREREELVRELAEGMKQEEEYRQLVRLLLSGEVPSHPQKHPFRRLLDYKQCKCPSNKKIQ